MTPVAPHPDLAAVRLRAYLDTRPPTRKEIAVAAGCDPSFVSRVASGEKAPTPRLVRALADLGAPVELIFRDTRLEPVARATRTGA